MTWKVHKRVHAVHSKKLSMSEVEWTHLRASEVKDGSCTMEHVQGVFTADKTSSCLLSACAVSPTLSASLMIPHEVDHPFDAQGAACCGFAKRVMALTHALSLHVSMKEIHRTRWSRPGRPPRPPLRFHRISVRLPRGPWWQGPQDAYTRALHNYLSMCRARAESLHLDEHAITHILDAVTASWSTVRVRARPEHSEHRMKRVKT